jgi:F420H(2)-dependent quinone reductase
MSSPQSRILRTHQWIYETTGGCLGHRLLGVPTLLLTTTGRRSGTRRTTALVYAQDHDGTPVVTASNGGADRPPGWIHNVSANSSVEVQVGRHRIASRAEVIDADHADYPRLWSRVNLKTRGRYDRYQQKTTRRFDLVKLHCDDQ